jgi:hypothetical protein
MTSIERIMCAILPIMGILILPANAASFSCKCSNGTECTVSCGGAGTVTCGASICSSQCDASSKDGMEMATILAGSLAKNLSVVTGERLDIELVRRASSDLKQLLARGTLEKSDSGNADLAVLTLSSEDGVTESLLAPAEFIGNRDKILQQIEGVGDQFIGGVSELLTRQPK